MKIFVTVGTTKFDLLIKYLDQNLDKHHEALFQIAKGNYIPRNFQYIRYSDDINALYSNCDVLITHAGAGSIFKALSLKKKILMVENLMRVDKHQTDIAKYMHINNHAIRCEIPQEILSYLNKIKTLSFVPYKKSEFTKAKDITNTIDFYYNL